MRDMMKFTKIRALLRVLRLWTDKFLKPIRERLKSSDFRGVGGASWAVALFILLVLLVLFVVAMDRMGITLQQIISDFEKFFGMVVMNGR